MSVDEVVVLAVSMFVAAYAIVGALAGITFSFARANVGNGPGWWVVVFSAGGFGAIVPIPGQGGG